MFMQSLCRFGSIAMPAWLAFLLLLAVGCGGSTEPQDRWFEVRVEDGQMVTASNLEVTQGDNVTIDFVLDKPAKLIHLHGYEIAFPANEGDSLQMFLTADAEGQFNIFLHGYGIIDRDEHDDHMEHDGNDGKTDEFHIATLKVLPR